MRYSLPFVLAVPALLAASLQSTQAQCSRLAQSHCSRSAQAKPECHATSREAVAPTGLRPALLRVGAGLSLSGSGDYLVTKTHLEYAPTLGRHWRLGSRLAYVSGSQPYEFGEGYTVPQSYRAVNLEQEVYWLPFGPNKIVEFSVGAGAFAGYFKEKGWSHAGFGQADPNGNQVFSYISANEQGLHVGYIGSLSVDCALNEARTWRVGGRLAMQNDTRANILPGGQVQVSRSL